jgi:IMP cyclohydrolase
VAALVAPVVDGVADVFAAEDFGEAIGGAAVFPLAGTGDEVDVASGKLLVEPGIGEVGEVVDGIVEIEIVVVHAIHKRAEIVNAGHGETALEDVRMAEEGVGGVISAKGCAHGGDGNARLAMIVDEGDDFLGEVGIEDGLDVAAMKGMGTLIVEAKTVDGVNAVELDAASVNEFGEGADHALAFEFPLVTGAGWETENGRSPVAIGNDAEIKAKTGGMPAVEFAFHRKEPFYLRENEYASGEYGGQIKRETARKPEWLELTEVRVILHYVTRRA